MAQNPTAKKSPSKLVKAGNDSPPFPSNDEGNQPLVEPKKEQQSSSQELITPQSLGIEMPPIDPHPSQNFFLGFEKEAKNLKWRYVLFGIFALLLTATVFLLKPTLESYLKPHPNLVQIYNPVSEEPKSMNLEINNPDDELLVYDSTLTVSGKTAAKSSVIISNGGANWGVNSDHEGNFSKVIDLKTGLNQITIYAFDPQGNNRADTRTVYYSEEKL